MTKKQVWKYKCDFCGKKQYRSMTTHEKHCTMNPNRECRLHAHGDMESQRPMTELLEAVKLCKTEHMEFYNPETDRNETENSIVDITPLREAAGDCPACILAALRQSGENDKTTFDRKSVFDFQKELASFWANANDTGE